MEGKEEHQPARKGTGRVLTELAELPGQTLLDEHALAACLRVTRRTVRRMVRRHELPPPVSFAGRSTWMAANILAHFAHRADRAAREAERESQRLSILSARVAQGRSRGRGTEEGKTPPAVVAETGLGKSPGEERI
jgi:predicted DNA-binding transcriptional regulator AlpA